MINLILVHGGWSEWVDVPDAKCTRTCGTGFKEQVRNCTNPVPECGGNPCNGSDYRIVACNEQCCPGLIEYSMYLKISCAYPSTC